jgi:hypothetical protein
MPIDFKKDRAKNFTTFTFQGEVTLSEMIDTMNSYGRSGVTLHELYDVRQLAGKRFSNEDIDVVVLYFRQYGKVRPEASKTAVLVTEAIDYGISRMIQTLTEGEVSFKVEIFHSMEKALAWLEVEPAQKT